jgi:DNA mismatch endonuclease (patch repair protein)
MADMFDKEKRSSIMAAVKGRNTRVELMVFRYLRQRKVYFQKHYKRALGNPDIALPRKKKAVFIDGDFWHGRDYKDVLKRYGPDHYWTKKIARNMERDKDLREKLLAIGWQVYQVWESDLNRLRTRNDALKAIEDFLLS